MIEMRRFGASDDERLNVDHWQSTCRAGRIGEKVGRRTMSVFPEWIPGVSNNIEIPSGLGIFSQVVGENIRIDTS